MSIIGVLSFVCAMFSVGIALLMGWKARKANRSLWAVFETYRAQVAADFQDDRLCLQRCYGRLLALQKGLASPVHLTAQHAEDLFLIDYFEGESSGFFIEVGAYDGIQFSNTYALDQLGWTGLLVEAHPENVKNCRKNRPKVTVEHAAVVGPNAPSSITFNVVAGRGGDLLSFLSADEAHLRRCRRESSGIEKVEVPAVTLSELIKRHKISKIDFLSIDIEGGEIDALKGIDFTVCRPRLILLEANNEPSRQALLDILRPLGYRVLRSFGVNCLFEDCNVEKQAPVGGVSAPSDSPFLKNTGN